MTAALLAFAAATLAVAGAAEAGAAHRRRPRAATRRGAPALLRMLRRALRPLARGAAPADLERRLAAAGRPGGLGVRELMAVKLAGAAAGGAWGAAAGAAAPGRLAVFTTLAAPVACFLAPDLWLARRAGERARQARRELPALLDLLAVAIDAGLPLAAALGSVGERYSGPAGREWRASAAEVALGVPLGTALAAMAVRLPLPEVEALAGTLARSARHGAPLAGALAAQARDARLAERRRVQEQAARAGPKIQLVVALLLVPSVLLMVAAALAAALLDGGASAVRLP